MEDKPHVLLQDQNLMINQISPLRTIHDAHLNSIESLVVHPNQKNFATGSHDTTIKIWDAEKFQQTNLLKEHKQGVWSLDYSKDGSLLASGGPDKSVVIWDARKNSPDIRINAHKDKVYSARFNETSRLLGTCGQQGELFIWDISKTNKPLAKIEMPTLVLYDLRWSGNEDLFFVTSLGSELLAYNSKTFTKVSSDFVTLNDKDSKCQTVESNFKLINNRIFCGTSRGTIAWYQMKNNKLFKEVEWVSHLDSVRTINLHPTKKIFLSTGRDGSAKLWNASSNEVQPSILGNLVLHVQNIPGAGFIGNDIVVTGSWDQKLALWNIKDLIK